MRSEGLGRLSTDTSGPDSKVVTGLGVYQGHDSAPDPLPQGRCSGD